MSDSYAALIIPQNPSFSTVFDLSQPKKLSTIFFRNVTNVGPPRSVYKVRVIPPRGGVTMTVKPRKLVFAEANQKLSYTVTVTTKPMNLLPGNADTRFGFLSWTDGKHVVQSPIAVTIYRNLISSVFLQILYTLKI